MKPVLAPERNQEATLLIKHVSGCQIAANSLSGFRNPADVLRRVKSEIQPVREAWRRFNMAA